MIRRLASFICLTLVSAHAGSEPAPRAGPAPESVLRWNNGETISGELMGVSATAITWKTLLFENQLELSWHALHKVDQQLPTVRPADPFSIALRNGSHLYADLVAITETAISIRSAQHGEAVLKRPEVLSVRRIQGDQLIFAGPLGDVGWSMMPKRKKASSSNAAVPPVSSMPPVRTGPAGALIMPYWNGSAFLELALPELVDLEFRVRSSTRPDFQLSMEGGSAQRVRLETWDDELVLAVSNRFKTIRKVAEDERELALRVCWDRKTRHCLVFSAAGELLAEWQVPEDFESSPSGVGLQSKGRDLSLEFLRVRSWDGKPPPKIEGKQPRVELAGGRMLEGQVTRGSAEAVTFRAVAQDADLSFPMGEVDAIFFSLDRAEPKEDEATLSFADGTRLGGAIPSIANGAARIETSFADEPVTAQIGALRQLLLPLPASSVAPAEPPIEQLDKLVIERTTLHGKLDSAGDASPRWLPVGGVTPAMLSQSAEYEISRALPPKGEFPAVPALLYTSAGDVLPGNLRALNRSIVEFDSSMVAVQKLRVESLDAIQFGAIAPLNLQGFHDPGWRVLKGDEKSVRREKDALEMQPETSIGHPAALQSSELKFSLASGPGFATIRLRLFCSGLDGTKTEKLILASYNSRFYSGLEAAEGQLANQHQINVSPGQPVAVRLVIDEKQVELHVNDVQCRKFPIGATKRPGAGLIIEPASMWGNTVQPIKLSDFSARFVPGRTWLPEVSAETKMHALTVPRFRKDDPPRHALLAANGDVLRGEIEAATATHFAFRSGLESLRVPRERVTAAIWLKKPEESAAIAPVVSGTPKQLEQRIEQHVHYGATGLASLIGVLQREAGLKFKLPETQDSRRFGMQFGGQTIGEALDQICSLFGLRYSVDAAGTIVLSAISKNDHARIQKIYWFKDSAFSSEASIQKILVDKGVDFPEGSAVLWKSETGELAMTNTVANHRKLTRLLQTAFDGSQGSPTHWVLLTSGARLGFIVDKFENDSISGHHPLYGRCQVPLSQVYTIRTSRPEQTVAMKSLEAWRLVFAPEPVLPESGGESSPLLGKEAKSFKLPLLEGGDFDLAQEKGKVVVLDFWATWCGPCIKALPGLIAAISEFPPDRVKLIGVNQSESAEQVKRFLETRGWKLTVAMDAGQSVARQYGVDGIPYTVIVGPDGKIAWVKSGYSAQGDLEASKTVKQLLASPAPTAPLIN